MNAFFQSLLNGIRLRCPNCPDQPLFRSFFGMNPACPDCGYVYEREDGYYIGAIYINMVVTLSIIVIGYYLLDGYAGLTLLTQFIVWGLFSAFFPLLFFRYSRGIWINLDYFFTAGERSKGNFPRKNGGRSDAT